jgi:hypothetical protein
VTLRVVPHIALCEIAVDFFIALRDSGHVKEVAM